MWQAMTTRSKGRSRGAAETTASLENSDLYAMTLKFRSVRQLWWLLDVLFLSVPTLCFSLLATAAKAPSTKAWPHTC